MTTMNDIDQEYIKAINWVHTHPIYNSVFSKGYPGYWWEEDVAQEQLSKNITTTFENEYDYWMKEMGTKENAIKYLKRTYYSTVCEHKVDCSKRFRLYYINWDTISCCENHDDLSPYQLDEWRDDICKHRYATGVRCADLFANFTFDDTECLCEEDADVRSGYPSHEYGEYEFW